MSTPPAYLSNGQPLHLAQRLARGGEGEVYDIRGNAGQVAKLYHRPVSKERAAKLAIMAQHLRTAELLQYTAWPLDTLHHQNGQVCGFVMEKLAASHDIHQLYGVQSRQQHFPDTDWRMLVRTALNTARAFAALHHAGFVIGDVNHGSVRVMPGSFIVKLIDTDSFQVHHAGRSFACEVGMPEFTPPGLQGISFKTVQRTANHDAFGLAVLIFQLLMNGWHPFSGVFVGQGDMTLKRAISEYRYAHSPHAAYWQMRPPPACLPAFAASPQIAALWDAAFTRNRASHRPTAQDWVQALGVLERNLSPCAANPVHHYWTGNPICPWCEMERNGIMLFRTSQPALPPLAAATTASRTSSAPTSHPQHRPAVMGSGQSAESIPLFDMKKYALPLMATGAFLGGVILLVPAGIVGLIVGGVVGMMPGVLIFSALEIIRRDRYIRKYMPQLLEPGCAEAQYVLGESYDRFESRSDKSEALKWYQMAANHGHGEAQKRLREIAKI